MIRALFGHWRLLLFLSGLLALCLSCWQAGFNRAKSAGDAALKRIELKHQAERNRWLTELSEQLAAAHTEYKSLVIRSGEVEHSYLQKIKTLEASNVQLKKQIRDVTRVWQDERGQNHPVSCVFTRGFVQQYNAAFGAAAADGSAATAGGTGGAAAATAATDTRLRDSGVSQRDLLSSATTNGLHCQKLAAQVNGLLDYIEVLPGRTQ